MVNVVYNIIKPQLQSTKLTRGLPFRNFIECKQVHIHEYIYKKNTIIIESRCARFKHKIQTKKTKKHALGDSHFKFCRNERKKNCQCSQNWGNQVILLIRHYIRYYRCSIAPRTSWWFETGKKQNTSRWSFRRRKRSPTLRT